MAISAESRHHLHNKLIEAHGPEAAATLMEYLPPVGWADVATKHDLTSLERRFDEHDRRFDQIDRRIDDLAGDANRGFDRVDRRIDDLAGDVSRRFGEVDARFREQADSMKAGFEKIDSRFSEIDGRFREIDNRFREINGQARSYFLTMVGLVVAMFAAVIGAVLTALFT